MNNLLIAPPPQFWELATVLQSYTPTGLRAMHVNHNPNLRQSWGCYVALAPSPTIVALLSFSAVLLALFKRKNNTYVAQISTYVLEYLHFARLLKIEETNRKFLLVKIVFTLFLQRHHLVEN